MKFIFPFLLFCSIFISLNVTAQKKILDNTVYNDWKRVGDVKISSDGKFSAYTIKPHRGDGYLYVVNNQTQEKDSFFRAVNPVFAGDNSYLAFKITPGFDTLRNSELNKVKKDKWPKDSLGVFMLESQKLQKFEKVKSFYVSAENNWLVYLQDGNKLTETKKKKKLFKCKKKNKAAKYESDGNIMVVFTPNKLDDKSTDVKAIKTKDVKKVYLPERSNNLVYTTHRKEKADSLEIHVESPNSAIATWNIPQKFNDIGDLNYNFAGSEIVFTASMDTSKTKNYQLFHADLVNRKISKLIDTVQNGLQADQRVSSDFKPYFSRNGERIFFGIAPKKLADPKDTLLENEKAKLDVWNWKDDRLQPQQLLESEDDQKHTNLSVYTLSDKTFKTFGSDTLVIRPADHGNATFALAYSVKSYQSAYNWEYPNKVDYYRVNLNSGEVKPLRRGLVYDVSLSTNGKYYVWFNDQTLEQYITDIDSGKEICITCKVKAEWLEDVNGMPMTPAPFGVKGWIKGGNEVLIQSKYDLWMYDISANKLTPLISGANDKVRYSLNEWESDSTFINFENTYVLGFHEKDKSMSFSKPTYLNGKLNLVQQFQTNHSLTGFKKAKYAAEFLFQQASLLDYPDVRLSNWNNASVSKQISNTNPQQSEYNWATVELVSWKSYSGVPLDGLLYKPENYDSTKKYPLLVYFYEMYSDELHNHYAPRPTASIIFPTEYASAGYFILIPDIRYKPGYPAKGAYDCIMSGTDFVLRKYKSVDSTRLGLQGQSWGGYQTAQLITMTTRYKAAMAGAPVGNMFSAYGGIRWGSGLNRQFQYERSQSRIGKTIWEAPELYVENSPIFQLPKVQTPLLIMHNDGDGAVPWYQGIELFTGLKRLNKPAWLLNYNGDDHNLMKNANRIDLSIRMRQFFDYYLMDKPAPKWLIEGVPAVEKGKKYGLENN